VGIGKILVKGGPEVRFRDFIFVFLPLPLGEGWGEGLTKTYQAFFIVLSNTQPGR